MLYDANLPDIYAFAAQLARAGLNDPKIWLSKIDPNFPMPANLPASILLTKPVANGKRPINVEFRGAPIAFAIAIFPSGTLLSSLPPTTPLAWTRGLLPYGTWSKNLSPYGEWGGFIVFNGGNLERYQEIENKLTSFAGKPTSNILETLPPGTRILQFTPKR